MKKRNTGPFLSLLVTVANIFLSQSGVLQINQKRISVTAIAENTLGFMGNYGRVKGAHLLERKGMSKWVETAMRPVPERSHMLKTWPTKAGPPPFPVELSPDILTVEGNAEEGLELDCGDGTPPLTAERLESKGELGGRRSGTQSLEVGWGGGGV